MSCLCSVCVIVNLFSNLVVCVLCVIVSLNGISSCCVMCDLAPLVSHSGVIMYRYLHRSTGVHWSQAGVRKVTISAHCRGLESTKSFESILRK